MKTFKATRGHSAGSRVCAAGLTIAVVLSGSVFAAGEDASKPLAFPPAPVVSLAPVNGQANLEDHRAGVVELVDRLVGLADGNDDALLRAELRLAAANVVLARQVEPECTRAFWGLTISEPNADDPDTLRAAFDSAAGLIATAEKDLDAAQAAAPKPEEPAAKEEAADKDAKSTVELWQARVSAAKAQRRALKAFHRALRAVLAPPAEADAARERRRAASEMAALLEDDDRRVAAAAGFWQAYLRKDEEDPKPVLSRLDYALDDFAPAERPYAFFSRLLRCMVLASHDERVAALALMKQMEERTFVWFPEAEQQQVAASGVAWIEFQTLAAWHASLDPKKQADEQNWCHNEAQKTIDRALKEHTALPRLWPAIPVMSDLPALEAKASGKG